jgi:tRNA dimethylallyltransferase
LRLLAIFGPNAAGKTGVAIAVAELLRERGEHPVAVNCDSIQVYRGLELLSGAATAEEQARLEHRLLSFVPVGEEFSAGRYAELARRELDSLLAAGRRPIVVGGTGLYLRAALAELDLRPPVPERIRRAVETEVERRGPQALHAELPSGLAEGVDPNDRKRIARLTELTRLGIAPHASAEQLWSEDLRVPATLIGITVDREELGRRVEARVDELVRRGALEEVHAADAAGASRTARAAIGFEELLAGDIEEMKRAQLRYARRQLTWMRRMEGVTRIDRGGRSDHEVAQEVFALLDREEGGE